MREKKTFRSNRIKHRSTLWKNRPFPQNTKRKHNNNNYYYYYNICIAHKFEQAESQNRVTIGLNQIIQSVLKLLGSTLIINLSKRRLKQETLDL